MMRNFKKVLAVVCSVSLMASSAVTAFAADLTTENGVGNVLAYSLESVIVPTSIKLALNPQGYTVTMKPEVKTAVEATYEAASEVTDEETFAENKAYLFTEDGGTYTAVSGSDEYDENATYYKEKTPYEAVAAAVTSAAQIVSFNYGIANFSTAAKDVNVSFKATATPTSGKTAITFVDSIEKAQAYDASTNADGAKVDELKMYLAVVAAKERPQLDASTAFGITTIAGGKDKSNVTAKALADVSMTKAENNAGAIAFAADDTDYCKADIAFKLGEAKYQVRDYETISMTTTQANLKDMMEIMTLGDITGFTFIGAMNPGADWTTADVTALTFVPTYTVSKITDSEEAVTGGYKQIKTAAAAAADAAATAAAEAATAAAGFKNDYADVITLTAGDVEGTDEELAAIEAAIEAFGELSAAAKALLAAEETPITADTLAAVKTACEAAIEANATPTSTTVTFDSTMTPKTYKISLPEAATDASDITNLKVNDIDVETFDLNSTKEILRVTKPTVRDTLGDDFSTTEELTFTFTFNDTNYVAVIANDK